MYSKLENYEEGFKCLGHSINLSIAEQDLNYTLFILFQTLRKLIHEENWNELKKIEVLYSSGIITDGLWIKFFETINEYSLCKINHSHREEFKEKYNALNPMFKQLLDSILKH